MPRPRRNPSRGSAVQRQSTSPPGIRSITVSRRQHNDPPYTATTAAARPDLSCGTAGGPGGARHHSLEIVPWPNGSQSELPPVRPSMPTDPLATPSTTTTTTAAAAAAPRAHLDCGTAATAGSHSPATSAATAATAPAPAPDTKEAMAHVLDAALPRPRL